MSVFSSATTVHVAAKDHMESLFAIVVGLGLRYVIHVAGHCDLKISTTLIGIWEGIVLLHFLQKMPFSFDPYVAYGVRLFIDFLVTESPARFALVVLWTGMGMVLADVAPAIWVDVGAKRIWHRFRRDLLLISRSVPSFPKPRTVRFSPSRTTSVVSSSQSTPAPSVISTAAPRPPPTPRRKSRVPGALDSETETERSVADSVASSSTNDPNNLGTARGFIFSAIPPTANDDDDDDDIYGSSASSISTERPDMDIPEIHVEPEAEIQTPTYEREPMPKYLTIILPPTPSDSVDGHDDNHELVPETADVPNIPDLPETADFRTTNFAADEDWEHVDMDRAPTPPAKDALDPNAADETIKPVPNSDDLITIEDEVETPQPVEPTPPPETEPVVADIVKPESQKDSDPPADDPPVEEPVVDQRTPPPSFPELYPDVPLDEAPTEPQQTEAEPVIADADAAVDAAVDTLSPPSPKSSTSALSSKTLNLTEALELRNQITVLKKQHAQLMKEHSEAKQDKAAGVKLAFTKKKEAEELQVKIQKLENQADSRSFSANNKGAPSNKIDVSSMTTEKALEVTEARLYLLLAPESAATFLEVTVDKKVRGRTQKSALLAAMKDHGMNVTDDPNSQRIFRITLPIND
ncbi:hypothetical protein C8J56DRAFT_1161103 [Mycena floridula]|nr:hypothetical protein C8J56DRAFT_1161103 [Mycena floridula]